MITEVSFITIDPWSFSERTIIELHSCEASDSSRLCTLFYTIVLVSTKEPLPSSMMISAKELFLDWFIRNSSIYSMEFRTSSASKLWPLEFFFMKSWLSSSLADGRFRGFICKQRWMKSLKSLDHFYGSLNDWTGLVFIMKITMNGLMWELGTCPSASSMPVTPKDQMSVFWSY